MGEGLDLLEVMGVQPGAAELQPHRLQSREPPQAASDRVGAPVPARGGRALWTETPSARIARQGTVCLIYIRGQARKARKESSN